MSLKEQLLEDMKAAMKDKDKNRLGTIRQIRAQIKDAEIAARDELDDAAVLKVLNTAAKRRREALDMYKQSERSDLAAQEQVELDIILAYLPKQISEDEATAIVKALAQEVGAAGPQDFGKLMKAAMGKLQGQADGKMIQGIVRSLLQ